MNNVLKKQNEEDTIKSLNKLKDLSKEKDASLLFTSRQARLIQCEIERLNNIINEITDLILLKKARAENEKDYSRYYIENFNKALMETHSTPDGIMLETIKSTTIKICSDLLDKLKELKEGR